MYESFFGFTERPFPTTPQLQGYFASEQIENALQTIVSCVERGAGPALVIASTGTGKTTLVLKLQEHFSPNTPVAILSGTNCRSPKSLLQNALFAVGLPYVDMDEGQMRLSLTEFFKSRASKGTNTLLLMDDADSLSTDLLEELLGFSSLTGQNGWCVPMVLMGTFRLEESLGSPRVASLNQRIAARCYVDSWSRSEVEQYIETRMEQSQSSPDNVFLSDSIGKVYELTAGVPRVVNQLCDHALVLAAEKGQKQIDEFSIEEAWSDLQRLPLPANHFPAAQSSDETESDSAASVDASNHGSIVEFGSLDDDDSTYESDFGSVLEAEVAAQPEAFTEDSLTECESTACETAEHVTTECESTACETAENEVAACETAENETPEIDATVDIIAEYEMADDEPTSTPSLGTFGSFAAAATGALAMGSLLDGTDESEHEVAADPYEESPVASVDEPSYPEQAEAIELQRAAAPEREESPSLTPPIAERDPGFLVPPATPESTGNPFQVEQPSSDEAPIEESADAGIYEPPTDRVPSNNLLSQQPLDPLESTSQFDTTEAFTPPGYSQPNVDETHEYELQASEEEVAQDAADQYDLSPLDTVAEFEPHVPAAEFEPHASPAEVETHAEEITSELPTGSEMPTASESVQPPVNEQTPVGQIAPLPLNALPPLPPLPAAQTPNPDFSVNPFLEEFDEEEVVLERTVGMSAAASRVTQSVETEEGKVLTNVLDIMDQQQTVIHAEPQLPQSNEGLDQETASDDHIDSQASYEDAPHDEIPFQPLATDAYLEAHDTSPVDEQPQEDEHATYETETMDSGEAQLDALAEIQSEISLVFPPGDHAEEADPQMESRDIQPLPLGSPVELPASAEPSVDEFTMASPFTLNSGFGDFQDGDFSAMGTDEFDSAGPAQDHDFTTMEMPSADYDAPPLGIPRGQLPSIDDAESGGKFDNLFTRLQDDE